MKSEWIAVRCFAYGVVYYLSKINECNLHYIAHKDISDLVLANTTDQVGGVSFCLDQLDTVLTCQSQLIINYNITKLYIEYLVTFLPPQYKLK